MQNHFCAREMIKMNDTSEKMVYDASDIQRLLGIGRSMTYVFLEKVYEDQAPFKVIKIGKLYRVPKKSFDEWLDNP